MWTTAGRVVSIRRDSRSERRTWSIYHRSAERTLKRPVNFVDAFCLVIICLALLSGHVRTQTSDPNGIHSSTLVPTLPPVTCYFCVNVSSNEQCNRFAIDVPCPSGQTVCHNTHVMDQRGRTISVDKKCSTDEACSSQVGCRQAGNQTICVGCCDVDYCNEDMAHNESSAIFHRTRTAAFSAAGPPTTTARGLDAFHPIWILSSILLTLLLV